MTKRREWHAPGKAEDEETDRHEEFVDGDDERLEAAGAGDGSRREATTSVKRKHATSFQERESRDHALDLRDNTRRTVMRALLQLGQPLLQLRAPRGRQVRERRKRRGEGARAPTPSTNSTPSATRTSIPQAQERDRLRLREEVAKLHYPVADIATAVIIAVGGGTGGRPATLIAIIEILTRDIDFRVLLLWVRQLLRVRMPARVRIRDRACCIPSSLPEGATRFCHIAGLLGMGRLREALRAR